MIMDQAASERPLGTLPITFGSARPVERFLGMGEAGLTKKDRGQYQLWVNIQTLVRNFMHSLDKQVQGMVDEVYLANHVLQEMEVISTAFEQYAPGNQVVFYTTDYTAIKTNYPHARFRDEMTSPMRSIKYLFSQASLSIAQVVVQSQSNAYEHNEYSRLNYIAFKDEIKPQGLVPAYVFTHWPLDLTSYLNFSQFHLIESYTGAIKDKTQWYTKYASSLVTSNLPFNRSLLVYFGDSEFFSPLASKYLRLITDVAEKYHWSALTTRERMRLTLSFHPNKELALEIAKNI